MANKNPEETPGMKDGLPIDAPLLPVDLKRVRPLGQRVVVKLLETEIKTKNGVIIPNKLNESFNRIGRVIAVGDGRYQGQTYPIFVKPGDICFFQLEQQQAMNTSYIDREHGMIFFLHNLDMIGTLSEPSFDLEYFNVVGPWILVKVKMRSLFPDSKIIMPDSENTTHELQTYTVVQVGSGVKSEIKVGEEVSITRSRCNPIYLNHELYGWIEEKFVYGAMTPVAEPTAPSAPAS
jgi:co-chaperonin GroES (HSP10)